MATRTIRLGNPGNNEADVNIVDGSLSVALVTTPTIDIGDVTLLAGTAIVGNIGTVTAGTVAVSAGTVVVTNVAGGTIQPLAGTVTVSAGTAYVGSVGGNTVVVNGTCTMSTAGTYAANDYVGVNGTAITFSNCARVNGGSGLIPRVVLIDYSMKSLSGELWLFDSLPAGLPNDNAVFTLTDAADCIGVVPFATYYAAGSAGTAGYSISVGAPDAAPISFVSGTGTKDLYGAFVTRGTPVYTSGDLIFRLSIIQD